MRDFGDAAGNDEAIGCEKIKCRNGSICFMKRLDWRLKSFSPAEIRAQDDLRFGGGFDEGDDVGFELGQVFVAEIHHVAGIIILKANVLL